MQEPSRDCGCLANANRTPPHDTGGVKGAMGTGVANTNEVSFSDDHRSWASGSRFKRGSALRLSTQQFETCLTHARARGAGDLGCSRSSDCQ